MYAGGFYPYETPEEYWAWWSRHILINRYDRPVGAAYDDLLALVGGKDYFVLTTNVDHCFQDAGFDKARLFYTQGDYGLWQCANACHPKTYDNEKAVRQMAERQKDMRIPTALVPRCPICGAPMAMNLRIGDTFVEDEGWHAARSRYERFVQRTLEKRVLLLELGVGGNTPSIIKYPFQRLTADNPHALYACVNLGEAYAPQFIASRAVCIDGDIAAVLRTLRRNG